MHDQPGITRDRIPAVCTRGTQPFVVWDTGGIAGAGESELTAQVRHAVQEAFAKATFCFFWSMRKTVCRRSIRNSRASCASHTSQSSLSLTRSTMRDRKISQLISHRLDFEQTNSISAEHNRGISELLETIDQLLPSPIAATESNLKRQTSNLPSPSRSSAAQTSANPRSSIQFCAVNAPL